MIVFYPKLSKRDFGYFRVLGSGLGNLLYPWARALKYASDWHVPVIFPAWPQFKIGHYLRRERDKRNYIGLFRTTPDYLSGTAKLEHLIFDRKVSEAEFLASPMPYLETKSRYVIEVTGLGDYFATFRREHLYIASKLREMTVPEKLPTITKSRFAAFHVRRGDFVVGSQETPESFYRAAARAIRRHMGDLPIHVFSDGSKSELSYLVDEFSARITSYGPAIADLLAMASSTILVCSRNSTFSGWASFLGRMPAIWPKDRIDVPPYAGGTGYEHFLLDDEIDAVVGCLAHATPITKEQRHG